MTEYLSSLIKTPPLKAGTTIYRKENIQKVKPTQALLDEREKLYTTIGGRKILKSTIHKREDSLKEVSKEYISYLTNRDRVLEAIGWQDKGGNPAGLQGLAKTVGASAALALGAGYSTPMVGAASLAKNILAAGVGMEGFAMLEGRAATPEELAVSTGIVAGGPIVSKGITKMAQQIPKFINIKKFIPKQIIKNIDRYKMIKKLGNTSEEEHQLLRDKYDGYLNLNKQKDHLD